MMQQSLPAERAVPPDNHGQRLDAALAALFPSLGVRARRRLWDWCLITVDGKARPPGFAVRQGQIVRVEAKPPASPLPGHEALAHHADWAWRENGSGFDAGAKAPFLPDTRIGLVAASQDYLAFTKPVGLHSAHIHGGQEQSLEHIVLARWQDIRNTLAEQPWPEPPLPDTLTAQNAIFLTRLDRGTSGLVLAARTEAAAGRFREMEGAGQVQKTYYAIVTGVLAQEITMDRVLLTSGRQVTQVQDREAEPNRRTLARPLGQPGSGQEGPAGLTLVEVQIQKGARHQIRAHLAAAGHPLFGDSLYGGPDSGAGFFLHHAAVAMPGFAACSSLPPWATFRK